VPLINKIKVTEAPPPPKKLSKVASELVAALNSLKKDEVLQLQPDEGKSMRGLKTSVGRIASNARVKVTSYEADDGFLYVRKAEK